MQCIPREVDDPSPYLLMLWDRGIWYDIILYVIKYLFGIKINIIFLHCLGELEESCEASNMLDEEENRLTIPGTLMVMVTKSS